MKAARSTCAFALFAACLAGAPAAAQDTDIDKLYELVRQARAELETLRAQAGIRGVEATGRGEHAEGRREGRGEHGEGRGESGHEEEGGKRLAKNEIWDETRNGARLILAYNAATQSFKGTVQNTTSKTLSDVRVEVHLSNGVELGPTKRTDLKPSVKIPVELSAANQKFNWWTTHPEHGSEEGHGSGHEGGARGEHGERRTGKIGSRPKNPALRPLYNEILLLRHEVKMLARGLRARDERDTKR